MFDKILIANRGEIALRIIRACRELGVRSVAVYSDADSRAPHVREADEAVNIGPPPSSQSYLLGDHIIEVAKKFGAQAIHPGYGFLSEREWFARAVRDAGLVWIGPPAEAIAAMGSKTAARTLAIAHGVPIVPGTTEALRSIEAAREVAAEFGYPVLLKAAAGGGGKGMRVVREASELQSSLDAARREAKNAFGDDAVQNLRVHVRLADGAALQHLRIVAPGAGDRVAHVVQARLGRNSTYRQGLIGVGSAYHLQRSELELHAPHAFAGTAATLFAAGSALEQQVQVSHAAAQTGSAVEALVLAEGKARAVVAAHTRIAPGSDDAAVRQKLAGIPTGGQPRLVLRPHLEIHHDQVQAAHGATWGALPEDALFYARQRGLDEQLARALIVEGMASAVLQRGFDDAALWSMLGLEERVGRAVRRHLGVEETLHG